MAGRGSSYIEAGGEGSLLGKRPRVNQLPPAAFLRGGSGSAGLKARTDFGPAPPGYRAGVGRGLGVSGGVEGAALDGGIRRAAYGAPVVRAEKQFGSDNVTDDGDKGDYSDAQYDEFSGYSAGLFDDTAYDKEDREADKVWEEIDQKLEERKQANAKQARQGQGSSDTPVVASIFGELKNDLASVTTDEWAAIPEIGDHSLRFKKKAEKFVPAPDSLLERERTKNEFAGSVTAGEATPNLNEVGEARKTVLSLKLNEMSDSVTGQSNVDPKGYLTGLNSMRVSSSAEVGDIKKARLLLRSVVQTNPKHGPGWIAYARLEEVAGRIVQARKVIGAGCDMCPESEDLWVEAARLNTPENARTILARGIQNIPGSVRLWEAAADLEEGTDAKRRVFRKAIEHVPDSVRLWKAAISLEEPNEARILLARAVEVVPHAADMWLALARLESYDNARRVLNEARKTLPTEPSIWIAAGCLEESKGNESGVRKIIQRGVKSLSQHKVEMTRDQWLDEARKCENAASPLVAQAIVIETARQGLETNDDTVFMTWMEDADRFMRGQKSPACARALYALVLQTFPGKVEAWAKAAEFEMNEGTPEEVDAVLERAVKACPNSESLWLAAASEKARRDIDGARQILQRAFEAVGGSENVWLAGVQLELEANEVARARVLLGHARERAAGERIWLKSAEVAAEGDKKRLLKQGLKAFPKSADLWLARARVEEGDDKIDVLQRGLRNCPGSVALWEALADAQQASEKKRVTLEQARQRNPGSELLWAKSIDVEIVAGKQKVADQLLARALQELPSSGVIWTKAIEMAPKHMRKQRCVDALSKCNDDADVVMAVAKCFYADGKIEKAKRWMERAKLLKKSELKE